MRLQTRTLSSVEQGRLLAALAVQPFLAAATAFFSFPLLLDRTGRTMAGGFPSDPTDAAVSIAAGVGIVALLVTVIGVWPTALWLVKRRTLTVRQVLGFGLGFANLPIAFGTVLTGGGYGPAGLLRGSVFASVIGVLGAAAFWLIVIRGRESAAVRVAELISRE